MEMPDVGFSQSESSSLNSYGTQGGAGGAVPGRQRQPVEDALGENDPRGRRAVPGQPEHRLGAGHRLEARCCAFVNRPTGEPPDVPPRRYQER